MILEVPSSNTLPDENVNVNPVELQINWKVLEDLSEAIKGKEGVDLNTLSVASMIKKDLDKNIDTLATALSDKQFCVGKDVTVVHEADLAIDKLKLLSSAFGISPENVEPAFMMTSDVRGLVESLQSVRPKIDDFLNHSSAGQEPKIEQMVVSESNNTTKVEQMTEEKNHVKGTGDGSVVAGNQSSGVNTHDANMLVF